MSVKAASTTCFYWTRFRDCSYNLLVSVLQHEYEYSKTRFFKLEYIYSLAHTSMENMKGIGIYSCSSHTCFPRLICQEKKKKACALKASFSKKSYLIESHQMHFPGLETPLWYRCRDNSRNTYFLYNPMRAEHQQLQNQPLDGNTQITVPVISSGPHLF